MAPHAPTHVPLDTSRICSPSCVSQHSIAHQPTDTPHTILSVGVPILSTSKQISNHAHPHVQMISFRMCCQDSASSNPLATLALVSQSTHNADVSSHYSTHPQIILVSAHVPLISSQTQSTSSASLQQSALNRTDSSTLPDLSADVPPTQPPHSTSSSISRHVHQHALKDSSLMRHHEGVSHLSIVATPMSSCSWITRPVSPHVPLAMSRIYSPRSASQHNHAPPIVDTPTRVVSNADVSPSYSYSQP
jgi:hypothetical protein